MRRLISLTVFACLSAVSAAATEWPWTPASVYTLTRAMNCESWNFTRGTDRARLNGALPGWLIFNEGPGNVFVTGGGTGTRAIEPFDGRLITFPGRQGVNYWMGLSGGGPAVVHICRM